MKGLYPFLFWLGIAATALADDAILTPLPPPGSPATEARLGTVHVHGEEDSGVKRFDIIKTEVVSRQAIEHKRAQTLADAVSNQVGVDAQNSCANCGSKRVTINGLRGEHTTVLIDGVPMHSAVSSFYGMDAVPVAGIESIEVSRGAGASLIAPEAIGGVVNIITAKPKSSGLTFDGSYGNGANGALSLLAAGVGGEGKYRLIFAGQLSHQGHWDLDGNHVSEAPDLQNQSFFVKAMADVTPVDKIEARYARQTVGILGGTVDGTRPGMYVSGVPAGIGSFRNDDVSQEYLYPQARITDVVGLGRHEGMVRWNHFFPGDVSTQLTSSAAEQKQDSLYMHGYDYNNRDWLIFQDARVLFPLGDSHFLTLGAELKNQDMTSSSTKLYTVDGLENDSFKYRQRAAYIQDVWLLSDSIELSTAFRLDNMKVDWLGQTAQEYELDQTLLAPRVHLKWAHNANWTSRLMYGRGYRPPLSFFESQHGLNEYGFKVQITDLEKSHALGYSLAFARPALSVTGSSHFTWLSKMAYADGDVPDGTAAIFRNLSSDSQIWANDVVVSLDVLPQWNLQFSYEAFIMSHNYRARLPAAPIEQRARFISDLHVGDWEFVNTFTWVAARDLLKYGYGNHYRTIETVVPDPLFPLVTEDRVAVGKGTFAPPFLTWDIYVGWNVKKTLSFYASVQNVLNYTQTGYGDSPLNWSTHGNDPSHFHLDNNHTWGPLRGRVFSVGLKAEI